MLYRKEGGNYGELIKLVAKDARATEIKNERVPGSGRLEFAYVHWEPDSSSVIALLCQVEAFQYGYDFRNRKEMSYDEAAEQLRKHIPKDYSLDDATLARHGGASFAGSTVNWACSEGAARYPFKR